MSSTSRRMLSTVSRGAAVIAFGTITLAAAGAALAGECPADQRVAGNAQQNVETMPKGVTDTVLTAIDLGDEPAKIRTRSFRLRRLVIEPGGIVPWHSHENRPAIIYTVEGTVTEYASTCAVPIVHKAGDVATETHLTSHWWKNTGDVPAVLLSSDLLRVEDDPRVM